MIRLANVVIAVVFAAWLVSTVVGLSVCAENGQLRAENEQLRAERDYAQLAAEQLWGTINRAASEP